MHSLRTRLLGLWVLSLAACVAVGVLLVRLSEQTTAAQVARAEAVVARACDLIRDRYAFYAAGWKGPVRPLDDAGLRHDLADAVGLALSGEDGVEGGIWQTGAGPLAYAFPTYPGSGTKTDLPAAERDQIQQVNAQAARDEQAAERTTATRTQTLLLRACPLSGPIPGLTAWAMIRVQSAAGLGQLKLGLGILLLLMVAMSAWLGRMVAVWAGHVRSIEAELSRTTAPGVPAVSPTGERELDRIIEALNEAGRRLVAARAQADALSARIQRAERLAGLGRVAAGVAHEIRNPIAALRLQGENALAGDEARRRDAIGDMLGQVDRLDGLVAELLAMTQRQDPRPKRTDLAKLLEECTDRHRAQAMACGVRVIAASGVRSAVIDPDMITRILDNLVLNAIRHASEGGLVALSARMDRDVLIITVEDTGAGVPPEMRDRLFEPFVTGRPDGTGLGLAIARELADAHGGRVLLRRPGGETEGEGAIFTLELPMTERACRGS
ncbi:MAG: HAMP domain-containing sensor histidine kinase [Xanthobacteraceae bacterium]